MKACGVLAWKGPKPAGALYVTCQLFKIYFKLGTVHLSRSVIRSIETARILDFEEFPVRDKVTNMYYTGRLEVFNENFPAADQKLSYALTHYNPRSEVNTRMILKYVIPAKLSIGILPKALKWLEMDMEVDEVECNMSILMYKNLANGYFAHKSKVVVLSKQDPFPKLNGKPVS